AYLKTLSITLCVLSLIIFSFYSYKNTHNAINLNGEQTKTFIFKGIAYDIYQLRPFDGTMSSVKKNITYKVSVRNGKVSDKIMSYYPNGNLKSMQIVKKGNGCSLFYYENGNLEAKYCLKNGQLDGIQQIFYENGNLKIQGYFQDNEAAGEQFWYRENGVMWYKMIFEEEKVEEFDEYGNFVKSITSGNDLKEIVQRLKEAINGWS
ncbi:hypothetical protein LS70_009810, partial [Helicobacter sp. MIT 11-5569]|uniref:toxin-antitoxin system YwqK family antitoxin n=1 Tax=Helicobacter sp. MIT 11-5569 TaxID=1548151 RepID=UPI001107A5EF